jgi:hypothetical protein
MLRRITEIEVSAKQAAHIGDLNDLTDDAEQQGQFRGYLCPVTEIQDEGEMVFDLVEEWGVPKTAINANQGFYRRIANNQKACNENTGQNEQRPQEYRVGDHGRSRSG